MSLDYTVTFACYNQHTYTHDCIKSLIESGTDASKIVLVDNNSNSETQSYYEKIDLPIQLIKNKSNMGCGVAWNQGILLNQSEWTIIMNNDVVVQNNFAERLINSAIDAKLKVMSPAMIEGHLNYDYLNQFETYSEKMSRYIRPNSQHLVCLLVHSDVWSEIGYFAANPKLMGYEDTIFFDLLRKNNIKSAITSHAWLHHFGSITQKAIKLERKMGEKDPLGDRHNYKILGKTILERKFDKFKRNRQNKIFCEKELATFGLTIHGTNFIDPMHINWL
jgi:GT2 family glycosyltransferase